MSKVTKGASFNATGKNRQKRIKTLKNNFETHGIKIEVTIVSNVGRHQTYMFKDIPKYFSKDIKK